ncbi:MAG: carbohydrate ABC transporter permease [Massiliimalia sp.]
MSKFQAVIKHILLIIMTFIMFIPLYSVFVMGTYYSEDIFKGIPVFPSDYLLENLKTVFKANFTQAYGNSLFISVFSVILSVLSSSMMGFALAKYKFRLRKFLFAMLMVIMMIPGQISMIGFIREMKVVGLLNTHLPLIITWMAYPFGTFFMTQFIRDSLPTEVMESGRLDGCSEPGIYFKIVLPFIKPGLLTLATLVFLSSWNSYMMPLLILNKQELYTIPLMVSTLSTQFRTDYGATMAALSIAILPMILIFVLCSKTFIRGIAAGAVKG